MQTRVPAWCDRVLLSPTAKSLVENVSSNFTKTEKKIKDNHFLLVEIEYLKQFD